MPARGGGGGTAGIIDKKKEMYISIILSSGLKSSLSGSLISPGEIQPASRQESLYMKIFY